MRSRSPTTAAPTRRARRSRGATASAPSQHCCGSASPPDVLAGPVDEDVVGVDRDDVVAVAAVDAVHRAVDRVDAVVARAAGDAVGALGAGDRVVARAAVDVVVAEAALEL